MGPDGCAPLRAMLPARRRSGSVSASSSVGRGSRVRSTRSRNGRWPACLPGSMPTPGRGGHVQPCRAVASPTTWPTARAEIPPTQGRCRERRVPGLRRAPALRALAPSWRNSVSTQPVVRAPQLPLNEWQRRGRQVLRPGRTVANHRALGRQGPASLLEEGRPGQQCAPRAGTAPYTGTAHGLAGPAQQEGSHSTYTPRIWSKFGPPRTHWVPQAIRASSLGVGSAQSGGLLFVRLSYMSSSSRPFVSRMKTSTNSSEASAEPA